MEKLSGRLMLWAALALWFAAVLSTTSEAGEFDIGEAMTRAQQLYSEQKYEECAEIAKKIAAADSSQGQVWMLLGASSRRMEDYDQAVYAFKTALKNPETDYQAVQGLIIVYAQQNKRDQAYRWLQKAREIPRVDLSTIAMRAEIKSLKGDPRFTELFPEPDTFGDPFLEDVRIIHEWRGQEGDEFGWEARAIGDVDDDNISDVAVSATMSTPGKNSSGYVVVYSGRTGEQLWRRDGSEGDRLGTGIEPAHDVDGDEVPDVIAGAPGRGAAFVFSGKDGKTIHNFEYEDGRGHFGTKVSGAGDLDKDGHADLMVGSPGDGRSPQDPGHAYVYSGKDGKLLVRFNGNRGGDRFGAAVAGWSSETGSLLVVGAPNAGNDNRGIVYVYKSLADEPAFTIESDETGQQLGGMFVSVVGDVNGDRVPDVYASDWLNRAHGTMTGRVYVHSGRTGDRLHVFTGEKAGDGFGIGPARAGDVDGDGHDDLVIGAWQEHSAAFSGGRVYVYSGKSGKVIRTYTGKVPGETLGFDADGVGDVDGDGVNDYLLTSAWSLVNGPRSGRTYIVSGD